MLLFIFFFSLIFHCLLLRLCLFYVMCALGMLVIKATYLLTYFILPALDVSPIELLVFFLERFVNDS